jgi:uracil-DNA glycosylase family 4
MNGFFSSSTVQTDKPVGQVPRCGSCGLYKKCRSPKMEPSGRGCSKVLIVGEAPGVTEDEEGRHFAGESGDKLREVLGRVGVKLEKDAWVTNALICSPGKGGVPDPKMIDYCRPNLLKTVETYEPKVIVTLGRAALASVIAPYWKGDLRTLEQWVGWKIPLERHWVVPTYHPSFLLRMNNSLMERQFSDHLEMAFNIEKDPPKQPDWAGKIEILYEARQAVRALEEIDNEGGWVAVDYETNCLKPEYPKAQAVSFAVSNGRRTVSYPWSGPAIDATGRFLASKGTRKIASNLKMEERWTLKMFGHGVRGWGWDTMLAAHCLDNRQGICSLKFQAFVHLGVPTYNERIEPYLKSADGPYNRIHQVELSDLLLYGGMDAILEYKLAMRQRKMMGYAD